MGWQGDQTIKKWRPITVAIVKAKDWKTGFENKIGSNNIIRKWMLMEHFYCSGSCQVLSND
jgi:hypothetical protein